MIEREQCGPEPINGPGRDMSALIEVVTSTMVEHAVDITIEPPAIHEPTPDEEAAAVVGELHPCHPIERVPPEHIWEVYGDAEDNSPRTAWRDLDLLLCDGGSNVEQRFSELRERLDVYCNDHRPEQRIPRLTNMQPKGEVVWYEAAMLRAALPAFYDRMTIGEVSPEAARESYRMLVDDVMPYIANAGTFAEVVVAALLARLDPEAYAFPASVREERSTHRSPEGKLFNHDLYQLSHIDDPKTLLQVKMSNSGDSGTYDSSVVRIHVHQLLARPVLGADFRRVHPRQANNPLAFLDYMRRAFTEPSRRGEAMLDAAALYLDDCILRKVGSSTVS